MSESVTNSLRTQSKVDLCVGLANSHSLFSRLIPVLELAEKRITYEM